MEKKKFWITLIALAFVFSASVLIINQKGLYAEECRLIRIYGDPGGQVKFGLEPTITHIKKGGCVVWVNLARQQEVKVVFEEGKVCKDVTNAPVGFKLDAKNCYTTTNITFGATTSLLFEKEGVYKYLITAGKSKVDGKIVVRASS